MALETNKREKFRLQFDAFRSLATEATKPETRGEFRERQNDVDKLAMQISERAEEIRKRAEEIRVRWGALEIGNRVLAPRRSRDEDLAFLYDCIDRNERINIKQPFRYTDWQLNDTQKGSPLVVIAVSGGGLRAAAWTFTVLRTLEERFAADGIDFTGQVRIISGASGGMFGAAYYVSTLPQPHERPLLIPPPLSPTSYQVRGGR